MMRTENVLKRLKHRIKSCAPESLKRCFYDRNAKLLEGIGREQKGLEIGPSHNPIAPKKQGYCVETVDWLSQKELREHYKNDGVDLEAIEPVDYVWKGGSYYQLIQKENHYDYIIASHMIEHSTDFVGFLQDCSRLLKKGGVLRLAVPDKRYCFDHYRSTTELSEVLNNAIAQEHLQSAGNVADYYLNVVARKGQISWKNSIGTACSSLIGTGQRDDTFLHDANAVMDGIRRVKEGEYIDIHHYVFTPASFELLIYDLRILEMTDMKIIHMWNTCGNEFIVTLKKAEERDTWNPQYRKRLLRQRYRQNRV